MSVECVQTCVHTACVRTVMQSAPGELTFSTFPLTQPLMLSVNHISYVYVQKWLTGRLRPEPGLCWRLQDASQRLNHCKMSDDIIPFARLHVMSSPIMYLRAEQGILGARDECLVSHARMCTNIQRAQKVLRFLQLTDGRTLRHWKVTWSLGQAPLTSKRTAVRPTS